MVDVKVFKVRSKDDGRLYAIKKSKSRFRGSADKSVLIGPFLPCVHVMTSGGVMIGIDRS